MKTGLKGSLILGVLLTGGSTALGQSAAATPEGTLVFTIHVYNGAAVDHMTLIQAERTATEIFKKAGVESRWVDSVPPPEDKRANSVYKGSFPFSHIQLTILPSWTSIRVGLPHDLSNTATGLAPGSGPDRQSVYVFNDRVGILAKHVADTHADEGQITGHVIAHEIGHLLLNAQTHPATGIMRSPWNLWDLQQASYGHLIFTQQQAQVIRQEVGRRLRQPPAK